MTTAAVKLTERDVLILVDLYKHRYLTVGQVQRLHFPSLQTAYRRTRLLKAAGLLERFTVAHVEEGIFALTRRGVDEVAGALGVDRGDLKWGDAAGKPKDYYFMRHFVAINDFRIALRQACDETDVQLLGFIPDYYGRRNERGGAAKYVRDVVCDAAAAREPVSHTPDGVFALERRGAAALFFLEIDRGTEVVSAPQRGVLKCLRFYAGYLVDGKYQRYASDFGVQAFKGFRTVIVTTSQARLEHIRAAAGSMDVPQKAKRFIWLATPDVVHAEKIFTAAWQSVDADDANQYSMLGGG